MQAHKYDQELKSRISQAQHTNNALRRNCVGNKGLPIKDKFTVWKSLTFSKGIVHSALWCSYGTQPELDKGKLISLSRLFPILHVAVGQQLLLVLEVDSELLRVLLQEPDGNILRAQITRVLESPNLPNRVQPARLLLL